MVEFICSGCSTKVMKHLSQLTRTDVAFCSLSCRNKNYKKALPNWHPSNYKEYIHVCAACDKVFIKNGKDFKPAKRSYCSKKCKASHLPRKPMSLLTKNKLSLATATQNRKRVTKHAYVGSQGTINMKSTWEVKYAHYLDAQSITWQYEPIFALSNGRAYLPDFQLSSGDIIEVKGYFRSDAKIKWDMFCEEYPGLKKSLVTKVEMKQLKLI